MDLQITELDWLEFRNAKARGDSRSELIFYFGSRTFEKLEARHRQEFPVPMLDAVDSLFDFAGVLR